MEAFERGAAKKMMVGATAKMQDLVDIMLSNRESQKWNALWDRQDHRCFPCCRVIVLGFTCALACVRVASAQR
jgi:hypothetical protein